MKLKFLGTGGYHPNERRHTASLMLPEVGIVFDAGTSAFRIPPLIQTDSLHIFLSHAHLDHIVGLTYLLPPILLGEVQGITVHGFEDVLKAVKKHLYAESLFPVAPPFEFEPLKNGDVFEFEGGQIRHRELLNHPGGSTAYRVDWSESSGTTRTFAYITDTTVDGSYTDFIRDVDVLIHECYFADEGREWAETTGHSYATAVAEIARKANVRELWLTHVDPQNQSDDPVGLSGMRSLFEATHLAEDLLELDL